MPFLSAATQRPPLSRTPSAWSTLLTGLSGLGGLLALAGVACTSCADVPASAGAPLAAATAYANWPDPLEEMPHGPKQIEAVCARSGQDSIRAVFCSDQPPPASLAELQARLHVSSAEIVGVDELKSGDLATLSVSGHSSALSRRSVSAINPRVIALRLRFTPNPKPDEKSPSRMLAVAFTRGEQFVELVASDDVSKTLSFYLVGFRQACNDQPGGCDLGDLLTEAVETHWTEISLYDETDLANSVLDCAPCHQPDGPGSRKLLRMQELDSPWTHWFSPSTEGGRALVADFAAAHGDESVGGMTSQQIQQADPNSLASMVFLDTPVQPNEFDSTLIEEQVKQSAAALGGNQPSDNSIPGVSATWRMAFERASRGEAIAVPYYDVKITDADKLAEMTAAYEAYRLGELPAAELPDIRAIFPDDPQRLAEMGIGTLPGLDGAEVLLAACAQCHNERLDQQLSRARFRADLQGMDRAEKDAAIARLMLPPEHPLAMPPARLRVLTREARQRAIELLRQ